MENPDSDLNNIQLKVLSASQTTNVSMQGCVYVHAWVYKWIYVCGTIFVSISRLEQPANIVYI